MDTGGGGYNWTGFGIEGAVFTLITEKNNDVDAEDLEQILFYIDLCQSKMRIGLATPVNSLSFLLLRYKNDIPSPHLGTRQYSQRTLGFVV